MSNTTRKQRSSLSSVQSSRTLAAVGSSSRTSARQTKVANQGFSYGDTRHDERDLERAERELVRDRKRKEQRLEELERGNATSSASSWNENSSLFSVPTASTSAAAIAGLLAGRQVEQEETLDDVFAKGTNPTVPAGTKRKQSADLRRLLTQRRSLKLLLEDAAASPIFKAASNNFVQALQVRAPEPAHRSARPLCSICGYWGDIRCLRCHERVCGLKCNLT
ncbi:hypothetical protein CBS101457_001335 [Exobasidium rhododendri]|nr:hypothetical protein CBS101457_001335 [Exobasidium rhododendri]